MVEKVNAGCRIFLPACRNPAKCLRAGYLMHQVAIDVEQAGAIRQFPHHVGRPDLFEQCFSHGIFFHLKGYLFEFAFSGLILCIDDIDAY
jgi:hypothetical protein